MPSTSRRSSPAFLSLISVFVFGERKSHNEAATSARSRQSRLHASLRAIPATIADKVSQFLTFFSRIYEFLLNDEGFDS
ncbi:hypothetical protein JCGZ_01911 [Jatropha curcas]|uniref:Uncharacterized protein n=1 Tax=Jatropha curcas TaxID=180498 RepID=A0A067L4G7_JATCU|nr:hypothetical protein JCGZ_01911 [Jatropha curcas]